MTNRSLIAGLASAAALVMLAAGCANAGGTKAGGTSDGSSSGGSGSSTLRMALSVDMATLDPNTQYQFEGSQVMTAAYEGLLDYAPDSTSTIIPLLAESYTVAPDGLTYTFKLHKDVTFPDGTKVTSATVKQSFQRFSTKAVQSQMAYMLAGVKGYETPDDSTFVVKLGAPNSSFLSLLASPFGPKVIDPKVLDEHKADNALGYLKTHTAGTGPYQVSEVTTGQQLVLTRNDTYWGTKPQFAKVSFKIIPDVSNQVLQLQGGDLDIISGQPIATVQSFAKNDKFQIASLPLLQKAWLHVNRTGALKDQKLREALRSAIDRDSLVKQVWGDYATPSKQLYPVGNIPDGLGADTWNYDASTLKTLAQGKTFTLAYLTGLAQDEQVVQALQAQWQQAGVDIKLVPSQGGDYFGFTKDPSKAPDLLYEASYPDSAHPDTWSRLFWYSDGSTGSGALNYVAAGSKESDALIDKGLGTLDAAASSADYGKSADIVHDQVGYISLADMRDVFIARAGLTGFNHWLPTPRTLQLKTVAESK